MDYFNRLDNQEPDVDKYSIYYDSNLHSFITDLFDYDTFNIHSKQGIIEYYNCILLQDIDIFSKNYPFKLVTVDLYKMHIIFTDNDNNEKKIDYNINFNDICIKNAAE